MAVNTLYYPMLVSIVILSQIKSFASLIPTTKHIPLRRRNKSGSFSTCVAAAIWTYLCLHSLRQNPASLATSRGARVVDWTQNSLLARSRGRTSRRAIGHPILHNLKTHEISRPEIATVFQIRSHQKHNSVAFLAFALIFQQAFLKLARVA